MERGKSTPVTDIHKRELISNEFVQVTLYNVVLHTRTSMHASAAFSCPFAPLKLLRYSVNKPFISDFLM